MSKSGPWSDAITQLRAWDATWADAVERMSTNPWKRGVLPTKFIELVSIGLSSACTNLQGEPTRRHIRAALDAGATREEILLVLKCATVMSIHSCSLGAPILLEEAQAAGVRPAACADRPATPACDRMRAIGQWNTAWDPFYQLDPLWTDEFMATGAGIYASGVFTPKEMELISIAFDASITHMYAPGVRRHIKGALAAGATMEEVVEVLKICVAHGVQALNAGVPILAEELERRSDASATAP